MLTIIAICLSVAHGHPSTLEGVNPEELGDYLEGDLVSFPMPRNGILDENSRWEGGIVPFVLDEGHFGQSRKTIVEAMEEYHRKTCIRFRPKTDNDTDYLHITNSNSGCWSSVGRQGGKQTLNLEGDLCFQQIGTAIHELMHALGFTHEQNRNERDDYVTVMWDNIKPGREFNFRKVKTGTYGGFGQPYDYGSVMHYSAKAFSRNGQKTIVPKKEGVKIGQREGFSEADLRKVNKMYNCTTVGYQEGEKPLTDILGPDGGGGGTESILATIAHAIGFGEGKKSK